MPGEADTDSPCVVGPGEVAILARGGFYLEDGRFIAIGVDCEIQAGAILRMPYSEPEDDHPPKKSRRKKRMEPGSETPVLPDAKTDQIEVAPTSADPVVVEPKHEAPAHHSSAPVESVVESVGTGDSADLSQVMGFAESFKDNPWAPLIVVVLALVAVLGGRQGWKFYSERSAQKHELELKKLEIQANSPAQNGQQPPICAVKDAEHEAKFAQLAAEVQSLNHRLSAVEKQGVSLEDFDPEMIEDLEKRIKKLEKPTARKTSVKE